MKTKKLLSLSTLVITTLTLTSINQKSASASAPIFVCESNQGVPTTVAKNKDGETQIIFNWNLNELETSVKSNQLCDSVTQKLNNYHQAGNDLSSLIFKSSTILDEKNLTTLPAICIEGAEKPCKVTLFTLAPSESPEAAAGNALISILDQDLQTNRVKSPMRGFQSTAYKVNFWQLFKM